MLLFTDKNDIEKIIDVTTISHNLTNDELPYYWMTTDVLLSYCNKLSNLSNCCRINYVATFIKPILNSKQYFVYRGYGYNHAVNIISCKEEFGYCPREKNNVPHGTGYENCRTIHAEIDLLMRILYFRDIVDMNLFDQDTEWKILLYGKDHKTGEILEKALPCYMCKRALMNLGINSIYNFKITNDKIDIINIDI